MSGELLASASSYYVALRRRGCGRASRVHLRSLWTPTCLSPVFCLALTPLLAIAPIQNTAHRHTANSSGPLLPGYAVPQWSAYRLPAFAIAIQHKSLPLFVSMHSWALYAFMGLVCSVEKSKAASSGSGSDLCAWSWGRSTPLG